MGPLPPAGGFLLLVLADTLHRPGTVRWFFPFAHLAAVPAEPWHAAGAAGMLAVAGAAGRGRMPALRPPGPECLIATGGARVRLLDRVLGLRREG